MSGLQLMNPPSDDLNKTKMVNNKTDMTTNLIPPSSIYPASQRTPVKVSFAYDASLKQASAITPGMAMQDNLDEDDTIDFLRIVKKGGLDRTTVGPTSVNIHQAKGNPNPANLRNMTTYNTFIPKVSPTSPFSKVCFEVGSRRQHRHLPKSWRVYKEWE